MSSINRTEIAEHHIRLDIKMPAEEISEKLKKALKKEQKNATLKGFRKGKAPLATIRKLYGDNILAKMVYDDLNKELSEYLEENKINYLGEPLPLHEEGENEINAKKIADYNFSFELGLMPEIDLEGWEAYAYPKYDIEFGDQDVDKQLEEWKKRMGKQEAVDEPIKENDVVNLELMEMEDGKVKVDGISTESRIHIESVKDEELKKNLLGKKIGDALDIDIYSLAPDGKEEYVRKYLLKIEDDQSFNKEFKAGIDEVLRLEEAEMNQEFFDKVFGPDEVKTEEEAREKTLEFLNRSNEHKVQELLFKEVKEKLTEDLNVSLPVAFVKKWTSESDNFKLETEEDFDKFLEDLRWSLIRSSLSNKLELSLEQEEIVEAAYREVYQYGIQEKEMAERMVQQLMSNKEYVDRIANNLETGKLVQAVAEKVNADVKKVSPEEFERIYDEVVKEMTAKQETEPQ
ncbi:MAG TPA: trigger factor [Saprospiraceae bacterium]|nr:trigger factor [Saprospiraceae bacterium]